MAPKARRERISRNRLPDISQYLDLPLKNWKARSCGIAALATVIGFWNGGTPDLKKLRQEAVAGHAYQKGVGWRHKELASLALRYGLKGKNFDWAPEPEKIAWKKFRQALKKGPVIASIHKDFKPRNGGHLIVANRIRAGKIFYHEPASRTRKGIIRSVSVNKFKTGWKKRIIAVNPETRHKKIR
ncbi:MAG: C39 family peptidase [Patescibacteria group bacterium]|nr:C39 family peptidase [Patescibacteria group bacterium]